MSKTCYKKGPGSTMMELDIYRDMNLNINTDCPNGWAESVESTYGYQGPLQCEGGQDDAATTTCYRCEGNMRQAVSTCGTRECPDTYDNYPIKCNYPSSADIGAPQPISYDRQYCACQERDGTVTGYSPLCCGGNYQTAKDNIENYLPPPLTPYTPAPKTAGFSSVPWYGWIVLGLGMAYFLKVNAKNPTK